MGILIISSHHESSYLVLNGMLLLLHLGQGDLQVVDVLLELGTLVLQLAFLGEDAGADLLLILQTLRQLLHFALQRQLGFDQEVAAVLRICEVVLFLRVNATISPMITVNLYGKQY